MDEEQIKLEKIALEDVSLEEFKSMQEFWKNRLLLREEDVCSRVINPLRFDVGDNRIDGYYRLICYLLEQERVKRISVRNGKFWMNIYKYKRMGIDKSELQKIAEIVSQDPIKKYYLNIKLAKRLHNIKVPVIEFVEYNSQIIGYEVGVPFQYRNQFNIVTERNRYGWNNGLWVPENYKTLSSPFA